ncbi:winged helix-turn-helix transcriptional regulator [Streptomyces sp. NPDC056660]|uniref:winged helix-turn-helix transcriptional regulator n=1 Tax=Streptomyces sp. NPDC056660 TaxID=3345897 RepID=UPI0036BF439F
MTLPSTYADRNCSLVRTLEVVGERWTLLIVRDAFFGVRRFGDFATQLKIPRAVLTDRLKSLVREGVLTRDDEARGAVEYRLTAKGVELWPVLRALMNWGDAFYSPSGVRRAFRHERDGGLIGREGRCEECGAVVPVPETVLEPGPGFEPADSGDDSVSEVINRPRRLLEPVTPSSSSFSSPSSSSPG